jgi:hypothetical protein
MIVLDIGAQGAGFPGTGELCRVISQESTHLSDKGKALSVRFQGILNKTKEQACDPKFHPLSLGTPHCSKFFRDDEKSMSRAQILGRIQVATDAMAAAGAGAFRAKAGRDPRLARLRGGAAERGGGALA